MITIVRRFPMHRILILISSLFLFQACASPIQSENPLTAMQKDSFYYPTELITVEYGEKAIKRLEKYDALNADEVITDDTPSGRELAKAAPLKETLKNKIAQRLNKHPGATKPMAINVIITGFTRATAARQILISSAENISAHVSIVDPETQTEVTNYSIFFGRGLYIHLNLLRLLSPCLLPFPRQALEYRLFFSRYHQTSL